MRDEQGDIAQHGSRQQHVGRARTSSRSGLSGRFWTAHGSGRVEILFNRLVRTLGQALRPRQRRAPDRGFARLG